MLITIRNSRKVCANYPKVPIVRSDLLTLTGGWVPCPRPVRPTPPRRGPHDHVAEIALVGHQRVVRHRQEDGLAVGGVGGDAALHRWEGDGRECQMGGLFK